MTTVALVGNQNCGKTTLFNRLTGSNQHVGNFPGVTVEKKEGHLLGDPDTVVVDLPGIYSLSPYTSEEIVTRDFIIKGDVGCIINIVDATNIERNLYLTLQLIEMNVPMVIALNYMDEMAQGGGVVDIALLSADLGVPVVPISASKNQGVSELIARLKKTASRRTLPLRQDFCKGSVHRAIHAVAHLIEDHAEMRGIPLRYAATKLVEGDEPTIKELALNENELDTLGHIVTEMETALGTDREAALADMRYTYIEGICKNSVKKPKVSKEKLRSERIDRILTHKYFALPIFLCIMTLVFWLTFGVFGSFLSDLMEAGIEKLTSIADAGLIAYGINPIVKSLIIDGIFAGVGSVLSFLPIIVVLFFFLALLEDSGYMARVAFVMDRLLRKIGLSGKSFVPMLIGFGCSVPAIMSTRTLSSERDRKMTILLTPFMSCSAKIAIYAVFTEAFFVSNKALVMIGLYVLGIVVGILYGLLLKNTVFRGSSIPFVMELPPYRLPAAKNILLNMWDKARDFIRKAFTIIFLATIIIWFLQSFDFRLNTVQDSANSMLAALGGVIAPIFKPLGFGDWRVSTALITGLTAKEAVVSTLSILLGGAQLSSIFTPLTAFSFLTFTLLYMPCVAALAAIKRELGSKSQAILAMFVQCVIAWTVAFVVYHIGLILL